MFPHSRRGHNSITAVNEATDGNIRSRTKIKPAIRCSFMERIDLNTRKS